MISLFYSSNVLAVIFEEKPSVTVDVKILINGQLTHLAEEPCMATNTIMLPLRDVATSLGASVEWKPNHNSVIISKGEKKLFLSLNSKEVLVLPYGEIFIMDQEPLVINGHTMVSLRFVEEALGAELNWDEKHTSVNIKDNGDFAELPQAEKDSKIDTDKYYKLYGLLVGPVGGPSFEEGKNYVLKEGLLSEVKEIQKVYTHCSEFGDSVTMVAGIDQDGHERYMWFSKDPYIGEISIKGNVLKDAGLSKEKAIALLVKKGIIEKNIRKIFIGPFENNQIVWFVLAEHEGRQYYYCVDFYSGVINETGIIAEG
ncbi:MAG TPA: stalk domain-containing protein [Syntrophomonadaceae bacterium]|nr:stalk domain-containing protein [Syntrophomonadaceae bacterium]